MYHKYKEACLTENETTPFPVLATNYWRKSMRMPYQLFAAAMIAAMASTPARAEGPTQDSGVTSGPAAGKPVEPSGSIQKENTDVDPSVPPGPSGVSAGVPGVEGKQGTQSGKSD